MLRATLIILLLAVIPACRKEDPAPPLTDGISTPFMSNIAVAVDSAFIQAPNLVTPNGDALNDQFPVIGRYVSSMQTTVSAATGLVVFSSTALNPVWSDIDSSDVGRYRVRVIATSLSGFELAAESYLDVMVYGDQPCLDFDGTPVSSEQLDPRNFGVSYPTNEIFCP